MQCLACQVRQIPVANKRSYLHAKADAAHVSQSLAGKTVFESKTKKLKASVHAPHRTEFSKASLVVVAEHLQTCFKRRQKTQTTHTSQTYIEYMKETYTCLLQVALLFSITGYTHMSRTCIEYVKKTYTCLPQVALSFSIRNLLSTSSLSGFRPFMALLARAFSFAVCSWTFLVSFVY